MDEEWISITEAAVRLTQAGDKIDRSSLSRYLKQHSEALPLKADGKSNLVDFVALIAHRSENVRLKTPAASLPVTCSVIAIRPLHDSAKLDSFPAKIPPAATV